MEHQDWPQAHFLDLIEEKHLSFMLKIPDLSNGCHPAD